MFKLDNKIGLGLAALGRPGYINISHDDDLGKDKSKASMRDYCHHILDFAYREGVRYFDTARVYGCLLYTSPSPRDRQKSRMPSSA